MKMITDYEVEGGWTTKEAKSKCRNCGTIKELVPEKGHYNSKYWELKRNDGLDLFCCPNGCSVKETDKKMKYYLEFRFYMTKNSKSYNYQLDYTKIKYGWIDRKGVLFPCKHMEHSRIAEEIFNKSMDEIEEQGYVKMTMRENKKIVVCSIKKPTRLQINTILDWAHANNFKTQELFEHIKTNDINYEFVMERT